MFLRTLTVASDSILHKLNTSELISKLKLTTGQNNVALYLSIKSLKICFALMSFITYLFLHFFSDHHVLSSPQAPRQE